MIGNLYSVIIGCLVRPHYICRFFVELVLAAVYIHVLSCDDFSALGISRTAGVVMVACTYIYMGYSLIRGEADRPFRQLPLLVVGRCILTIIIDCFLFYLSCAVILRMLANGPEFFSDNVSIPADVEYSEFHEFPDESIYGESMSTNCNPYIMLTADYPQVCYGAVNPGASGRLRVRVYEVSSGACLLDTRVLDEILECCEPKRNVCGWSRNDGECFTFQRYCPISDGRKDSPYVVSVELWFSPQSGEPMCMLLSRNFLVSGRF